MGGGRQTTTDRAGGSKGCAGRKRGVGFGWVCCGVGWSRGRCNGPRCRSASLTINQSVSQNKSFHKDDFTTRMICRAAIDDYRQHSGARSNAVHDRLQSNSDVGKGRSVGRSERDRAGRQADHSLTHTVKFIREKVFCVYLANGEGWRAKTLKFG